jgi:hypothetical protein
MPPAPPTPGTPGSNNIVPQGADYVFAFHDEAVDLTGLYGPVTITMPDGSQQTIPAPDVVFAPRGFIYAYDQWGRRLDPRRFAGPGGTPLVLAEAQAAPGQASEVVPPARPQPERDWSAVPGVPDTIDPMPPMPLPAPPPPAPEVAPVAEAPPKGP